MIYTKDSEYRVKFYYDFRTGKIPVKQYLDSISKKDRIKILKYIEYLRENKGVLDEPLCRHITGKIRELRVDFARNRHRIFFFTFVGKNIILLHAFLKQTPKTPAQEISIAENYYYEIVSNRQLYEK